jgi:transposase-like protein
MTKDIPDVFSGIVEVDDTYLGGQWKNKRKAQRQAYHPRGRGTLKQPVFGILCRSGKVWAVLRPDVESSSIEPILQKQVKKGTLVCSDTWRGYTGIAAKGYVHRLVEHKNEYVSRNGNHINGLEGFWGYLKRKLQAKGGIRRSRLHLYLSEYVWRFNHRKESVEQRVEKLYKLLKNSKI